MQPVLTFAAENPILTIVLVYLVGQTLIGVACGLRGKPQPTDDEDD